MSCRLGEQGRQALTNGSDAAPLEVRCGNRQHVGVFSGRTTGVPDAVFDDVDILGPQGLVPMVFSGDLMWGQVQGTGQLVTEMIDQRRVNDGVAGQGRLVLTATNIADHFDFGHCGSSMML